MKEIATQAIEAGNKSKSSGWSNLGCQTLPQLTPAVQCYEWCEKLRIFLFGKHISETELLCELLVNKNFIIIEKLSQMFNIIRVLIRSLNICITYG